MSEETAAKKSAGAYVDSTFTKMRANPWMPAAVVLGIILIAVLFMRGGVTGNVVSQSDVSSKILALAQAQIPDATIKSATLVNGHYEIVIGSASKGDIPISVSGDGNYMLQPLPGSNAAAGTQTQPTASKKISELDLSNDPTMGNKDAKVTVVEFSDFSCPYCEAASGDNQQMVAALKQQNPSWEPIVTNLIKDYVNTGKVKFVYVYAMGHTGGHPASLVGWCLNDQSSDKYWQFYTRAFASSSTDVEDLAKMQTIAKGVGADMTKLQACLDSKKYDGRFAIEEAEAASVGVSGTPAFFVGDQLLEGAVPYSQFKQAVDAALAKTA